MTVGVVLQVAFGALAPFLVVDLELSRTQVGSLTTAMYLTAAVLSISAGRWTDATGVRIPLAVLFGSMASGLLVVAAAPGYTVLVLGSLVAGVAISIANPVTNMVIQQRIPRRLQGTVTGIKQAGIQVGVFVGSALLPVIAGVAGWRTAVLACLLPCVLGAVLIQTIAKGHQRPVKPTPDAKSPRPGRRSGSWTEVPPGTGWLAACALMIGVSISCASAYLPLFAVESLGFAETRAGLTSSVVGAVAIFGRLFWGRLADRVVSTVRWALTAMAALAILAAAVLVVAAATAAGPLGDQIGSRLVWLAAVIIGLSSASWNGVAMLAVIRQAPAAVAGLASGAVVFGFYAGFALGPLLFGAIVDASGYTPGWLTVAAASSMATVLAVIWRTRAFGHIRNTP